MRWFDRARANIISTRSVRRRARTRRRHDDRFRDRLEVQIESGRRYNRRFSITMVTPQAGDPVTFVEECLAGVRRLDAAALLGDEVILLWADTDRDGASTATRRLLGARGCSTDALIGHATFPADGFTLEALLDAARERPSDDHDELSPSDPPSVRAVAAGS